LAVCNWLNNNTCERIIERKTEIAVGGIHLLFLSRSIDPHISIYNFCTTDLISYLPRYRTENIQTHFRSKSVKVSCSHKSAPTEFPCQQARGRTCAQTRSHAHPKPPPPPTSSRSSIHTAPDSEPHAHHHPAHPTPHANWAI
jgi:hypothetical protein